MNNLLSPQYSNSNKQELFKNRSPSFRNKRIPSVQDPYLCYSNQNLKGSKQDSPSKCSQEIKRRKSHYLDSNQLSNSTNKKRQKGHIVQHTDTQNIINSIQDLKEQYRALRQAYKDLIQEKVKNNEEMAQLKKENTALKSQIEQQLHQHSLKVQQIAALNQQLVSMRAYLDKEKQTIKKLQNDLYFMTEREKSKTDTVLNCRAEAFGAQVAANGKTDGMFGCQNEGVQEISFKSNGNESHILSFSLTSVIDESFQMQQLHRRRKQHVKVVSDLSHTGGLKNQFSAGDIKAKKQTSSHFKKQKKDGKMEVINQSREYKASSMLNPLNQLLNLKSPVSHDKKHTKAFALGANSTGKRKKLDEKQNLDVRNPKKKSKKVLLIGSNQ